MPPTGLDRLRLCFTRGTNRSGAVMPFLTGGYPSIADAERAIRAVAAAGASAIELGIPFSDPIADGPVIAASMHAALGAGATPRSILDSVRRLRDPGGAPGEEPVQVPILAMVSISIVDRIGPARFIADAAEAGIDGLIVPDLDLDEAPALRACCDEHGVGFTQLVAPSSSPARVARIASLCSGFLYLLARSGITGERDSLPSDLAERIALVRSVTDLPIAVGFGISTPAQVRGVLELADGAIVGSALVRRMTDAVARGEDSASAAGRFVAELVGDGRGAQVGAGAAC